MGRPKKKDDQFKGLTFTIEGPSTKNYIDIWNNCCDEWEEFLPKEKELDKIIKPIIMTFLFGLSIDANFDWTKDRQKVVGKTVTKLTRAISKRLRGEGC